MNHNSTASPKKRWCPGESRLLYHSLFTFSSSGLLHQRGPLWPTYSSAWDFFISNFKPSKVYYQFTLRHLEGFFFCFFLFFPVAGPVSTLNYLTRTPGSKALMRPVRPLCVMQIEVFLMKASWIIHKRCSTRRNTPQEHIRGGKNCFGKIKIDVSSISPFRLISRAAHHLLINRRQQTEITRLISVQSAGGVPAPCPLRCSVCSCQLLLL